MFIIGTGRIFDFFEPRYLKSEIDFSMDADFAHANETPKIEFAPNLDLFEVPSNSIIFSSIFF